VNVDNSCAGGTSALHLGGLSALAEDRPVLVVGVEKMWTGDRHATLEAIEAGLPADYRADMHARLAERGNPAGSILMGLNAAWAEQFMAERGATIEQIAAAAVKARRHGSMNPLAQCQSTVTSEEVLGSPQVAGVLTRQMCSSFTDGAAAVVVGTGHPGSVPLARIVGSVARSGCGNLDYHDRLTETARAAYEAFGLGPQDFDMVELHDATSAEELFALESLEIFGPGEAGPATLAGDTAVGGRGITVNPSGGLVARGHPLGATGIAQVVELVTHLAGRAGHRQVEGARLGLAVNTGGVVDGDAGYVGMTAVAGVR
jgi:acetyl-CoA acetyltransferase